MRIQNEQEKREKLIQISVQLSESQDILKESKDRASFYRQLEDIYYNPAGENFRHYYSDIFSAVSMIDADITLGSIDVLGQNLEIIKDGYEAKNKDNNGKLINIKKEIIKLYDHTNLEIGRINCNKSIINETQSELVKNKESISNLKQTIEEANNNYEKIHREMDQSQERLSDIQREYVTILGIFASIVLAFTGGMVFSSSVLENIDKSSVYRISLVAFIIGLVFFNLIWVLIDFIRQIIDKGSGNTNNSIFRNRFIFIAVNAILICGIIFTCISYKYDWFSNDGTAFLQQFQLNQIYNTSVWSS